MLDNKAFNNGLIDFVKKSPTPFHAVQEMELKLKDKKYQQLFESDEWQLKAGQNYYVKRNDSSLIAFQLSGQAPHEKGFCISGSHTDSPNLKIKPNPEILSHGYWQLGVEVYGGALLAPWFDRDLSIAGRATYLNGKNQLESILVDFQRPIAIISSLAIHLNRDVNESHKINKQSEMPPVLSLVDGMSGDFKTVLKKELEKSGAQDVQKIMDYELSFYDSQAPAQIGLNSEFIASARLDNLLSCYIGLNALLTCNSSQNNVFVANDHEEVGSASTSGADGTFLSSVLKRICNTQENFLRAIDKSIFISTDNAHAVHPNYPEKHDHHHRPTMNKGPVLKVNANQRYATNSETGSLFIRACERAEVPFQKFVSRTDMACGSTIGPITASVLGIKTVDVGVPTLAMHSVRELCGVQDPHFLYRALSALYTETI